MKTFVAVALMGVASAEITAEFLEFANFVAKYNKTYQTVEEYKFRKEQFFKTHAFIEEINNSNG